jgi:hypothetical protein
VVARLAARADSADLLAEIAVVPTPSLPHPPKAGGPRPRRAPLITREAAAQALLDVGLPCRVSRAGARGKLIVTPLDSPPPPRAAATYPPVAAQHARRASAAGAPGGAGGGVPSGWHSRVAAALAGRGEVAWVEPRPAPLLRNKFAAPTIQGGGACDPCSQARPAAAPRGEGRDVSA